MSETYDEYNLPRRGLIYYLSTIGGEPFTFRGQAYFDLYVVVDNSNSREIFSSNLVRAVLVNYGFPTDESVRVAYAGGYTEYHSNLFSNIQMYYNGGQENNYYDGNIQYPYDNNPTPDVVLDYPTTVTYLDNR